MMSQKVNQQVVLFSLIVGIFLQLPVASSQCPRINFQCSNGKCVAFQYVCDGADHCGDNSDEQNCVPYFCHPKSFQCLNGKCVSLGTFCSGTDKCGDYSSLRFCNIDSTVQCPPGWIRCPRENKCIPSQWVCNGIQECSGESEEKDCSTIWELKSSILRLRKPYSRLNRWGSQVHRIAVALHIADLSTFSPLNSTGEEIRNELSLKLLQRLAKDKKMSSHELALYIHALLVTCVDPSNFYGQDLVRELRRRVEASGNYTNPFLILALCNAGDTMTVKDVDRVTAAYDSQRRPFWIDTQAMASMALSCISSRSDLALDERNLKDMLQELKKRQFRNGTVDNFRTTALVTQALFIHDSYRKDFDLKAALKILIDGVNGNKSFLDAYYTIPALHRKSLLNVTSGHCRKSTPDGEEESLQKVLEVNGEAITVQYSVWMGDEINVGQTWRLRMPVTSTVYDAIENVAKIDNRQKIEYNIVDGKPYVMALNGMQDDPEMGMYWFVYLKTLSSDKNPRIVEESPVDVKLKPNQEIILWYKRAPWSDESLMQNQITMN